jgi:hypothetical protein
VAEGKYVSKLVVVQFDPEEREVQEQKVRSVSVRCTATQAKINATVWSNFKDVPIAKHDVLVLEGKASQVTKTGDDGETRTYNNLSVNGIRNLGALAVAKKPETTSTTTSTDDIPF